MKKIEAIVRASKFEDVKDSLSKNEINFFSFFEIKGYGHETGKQVNYRGGVYDIGYIGRIKLEIIVSEPFVETAIQAIAQAARTGEKGDGIISIYDLANVINIRTGLTGTEAINK